VETRHKCVDANKTFAVTRTVTEDGPATEKDPAPAGDATSDAKTSGAKTHDAQTTDEHAKATSAKAPAKAPADDVKDKTTEVLVRQYKAFKTFHRRPATVLKLSNYATGATTLSL